MVQPSPAFSVLLVDTDQNLVAETAVQPGVGVKCAPDAGAAMQLATAGAFDAIFVDICIAGGLDLVRRLASVDGPAIIAMAGHGIGGRTLEHSLTLAELRGAAASYPKPIEAAELIAAARKLPRPAPSTRRSAPQPALAAAC